MKRTTVFSIALLVAFFLPWIDINFITLSGYSIPITITRIGQLPFLLNENDKEILLVSYSLYFLPLLAIISIISDFIDFKFEEYFKKADYYLCLVFSVVILIILGRINSNLFSFLGIGFYLSIVISILGILIKDKELFKKEATQYQTSTIDQQLEKLKELREKSLISEEDYEKKKEEILTNFGGK